ATPAVVAVNSATARTHNAFMPSSRRRRQCAPPFAAILAARGWRVSRGDAAGTTTMSCRRAIAAIAGVDWVDDGLTCGRWMHDRGRGATRSRAAERRCRTARRHVGLQARNALIGGIGLLRLLAHDHAVIRAAEHTRCALEAERKRRRRTALDPAQ